MNQIYIIMYAEGGIFTTMINSSNSHLSVRKKCNVEQFEFKIWILLF